MQIKQKLLSPRDLGKRLSTSSSHDMRTDDAYLLLVLDIRHGALLAPVDAGRCLVVGVLETRRLAGAQARSLQLRPAAARFSNRMLLDHCTT